MLLHQTLDARLVARGQQHRLIDAKAAVLPSAHVLDHLRFDLLLGQVQTTIRSLNVIDSITDIEPVVDDVNARLARGEKP